MNQKRSDKANYLALLVVGVALFLFGGASGSVAANVIGLIALVGAAVYYWRVERAGTRDAPR